METIDVAALRADPGARWRFLERYVGFGETDWAALSESVAVLGPQLPALLDALYDHLLSFDDTRRIFLGERGDVDPTYLAIRKEHLTDWVLRTVGGGDRAGFGAWLMSIGRRHTGVEGDPGRVVPPRYMVGLTGFIQTAVTATLFAELPGEPTRALRYALAWNKMLVMQLEVFLKALAPSWPHWDEG